MTIDPGGGLEWMVDLEGWGSNLHVWDSNHFSKIRRSDDKTYSNYT